MNFERGLAQSDTGYSTSGTTRLPLSLLTELQKRLPPSHKVKYDAHSAESAMLSKTLLFTYRRLINA